MHGPFGSFTRKAPCEGQLHYSELTSVFCNYLPSKPCGVVYVP